MMRRGVVRRQIKHLQCQDVTRVRFTREKLGLDEQEILFVEAMILGENLTVSIIDLIILECSTTLLQPYQETTKDTEKLTSVECVNIIVKIGQVSCQTTQCTRG